MDRSIVRSKSTLHETTSQACCLIVYYSFFCFQNFVVIYFTSKKRLLGTYDKASLRPFLPESVSFVVHIQFKRHPK